MPENSRLRTVNEEFVMDAKPVIDLIVAILSLVPPSYGIYTLVKNKLSQTNNRRLIEAAESTSRGDVGNREVLDRAILETLQIDPQFAVELQSIVEDTNNRLIDCLNNKFLNSDVREVYARLGIGFDDLVAGTLATKADKVSALIEYLKTRNRLHELIAVMLKVRSDVVC